MALAGESERALSTTTYLVTQRVSGGAGMAVDIAASTGPGLLIRGDAVTQQGLYHVPPHSALITETIATADATNPRIDSVICELKDDTHDASGSNLVRTRVVTGTPIAAVTNDAPGASPAALPASAMLLAYVQVDAGATSILTAKCKDMRPNGRYFTAYRSTAASYATGATVIFNSETDPNGWYNTTTGVFLPTVAGTCRVSWGVRTASLTTGNYLYTTLTGPLGAYTGASATQAAGSAVIQSGGSALIAFNGTTDSASVSIVHNQGGSVAVSTDVATHFEAEYIGA